MKNMLHSGLMAATLLATGATATAHEAYDMAEVEMDQQVLRHERRMRKTQRPDAEDYRNQSQVKRRRFKSRDTTSAAPES